MFLDDYKNALEAIEQITAWVSQEGLFNGSEGQKFAEVLYQKADLLAGACAAAADCEYM